jgi:hypothetical protein
VGSPGTKVPISHPSCPAPLSYVAAAPPESIMKGMKWP